jgi:hypothetical protein
LLVSGKNVVPDNCDRGQEKDKCFCLPKNHLLTRKPTVLTDKFYFC